MALTTSEPFKAPTVERLSVRLVVDSYHDIFMPKAEHPHVKIEHVARMPGRPAETFACEWGLSLHLESEAGGTRNQYLLDFGFTPEVLNRNFDLLGIEPGKLDGLILSHSHRDHYGGMVGFVGRYRAGLRDDVRLYTGAGNLAFREKWTGARGGDPEPVGALDGAALTASHVETVCCEHAHALGGGSGAGPFTSGPIAWQSFERVTPTTLVEPTPADHFTEAERRGRLVLDKHPDEHATCYVVQGRGLVVISSCGHCGVINTIKTAQAVSGVEKVHAVIGGFHLGAAPVDYIEHTVAELKALAPDVVVPMHCTGRPFIDAAVRAMPAQVVQSSTGSRFTFGV
jgi:7,8-dihydropterin-6-yl-methyl-4-(beta-D-ribofuranosyl)aminobenzene 5'-phosphate synthase